MINYSTESYCAGLMTVIRNLICTTWLAVLSCVCCNYPVCPQLQQNRAQQATTGSGKRARQHSLPFPIVNYIWAISVFVRACENAVCKTLKNGKPMLDRLLQLYIIILYIIKSITIKTHMGINNIARTNTLHTNTLIRLCSRNTLDRFVRPCKYFEGAQTD